MKSCKWIMMLALSLSVLACERDPKQPGYEIKALTDMVYPVPYEAFQKTDAFREGQTLLTPPAGSIPRGFEPFPYAAGEAEAIRAGNELKNPIESNAQNIQRGQQEYSIFCQECHGSGGQGDGPLIPKFPNPPSLTSKRVREFADGRIYHVIARGGSGGIMPGHATQISSDDRWKIVLYVRSLQSQAK